MTNHESLTIALTYDLKSDYDPNDPNVPPEALAEFAKQETITAIFDAMKALGHFPILVGNIMHLVEALTAGKHREWDLAFNIAEGLHGTARVAQIPSILEAFQVSCLFSDARTMSLMHDKALTKVVMRDVGVRTAPSTLIKSEDTFNGFDQAQWISRLGLEEYGDSRGLDLFIKLNAEGTSKGTGAEAEILDVTEMLWPAEMPSFCTWFSKIEGEEGKDWAEQAVKGCNDDEVVNVEKLALQAWSAMGCRDSGRIDIRSKGWGPDAEPHVLEVIMAIPSLSSL
ncbi:hypothetical protein PRZ48_007924 [Zasmidium cellare]|uniref:Uncharacterized protein n=1 Tax=Zasmidium cellare TaxID=395010 RepID=A0ABR0EF44_ZASCE|nr:hypothetical protein PRZ48_007924 [Zasmidium cellare]